MVSVTVYNSIYIYDIDPALFEWDKSYACQLQWHFHKFTPSFIDTFTVWQMISISAYRKTLTQIISYQSHAISCIEFYVQCDTHHQ